MHKKHYTFPINQLECKRGFTLIELLVVIFIIGSLATLVFTSLNTARVKARDVRRISDLRQVALALEMYYDDNTDTGYPGIWGSNTWSDVEIALGTGDYITAMPIDPLGGDYEYWVASDNQRHVLKAVLEEDTHPALQTDADGGILGCDCEDPAYCIHL